MGAVLAVLVGVRDDMAEGKTDGCTCRVKMGVAQGTSMNPKLFRFTDVRCRKQGKRRWHETIQGNSTEIEMKLKLQKPLQGTGSGRVSKSAKTQPLRL